MGVEKGKENEEELMKLTILELRTMARKKNIEVSGIIRKKDLVDKIIASGIPVEAPKIENVPPVAPVSQQKIIEEVKETPIHKPEKAPNHKKHKISDEKLAEMRQYVTFMMSNKPSFFTIDGKLEAAALKYSEGNYYAALKEIQDSRKIASDIYSHFRLFTNALGINAAEKALAEAVKRDAITQDAADHLLQTAMEGFVDGTPTKREETLEKLEKETIATYEKMMGDVGRDLEIKQKKADELKSIGANVIEASAILSNAANFVAAIRLNEAKDMLAKASDLLKKIEIAKMEEIKYHIPRVRTSIDEARSLDLDVKDPEQDLQKASYDFERGDLKQCVEKLLLAEKTVDKIIQDAFASNPSLKQKQLDKAKATMQRISPFLNDAATYGIEVSEAQHYLNNTQMALGRSDAMNAPKFARRADDLAKQYEQEIKRLKDGSRHATGIKCWQCKQEMLYDYPNRIRRCSNCGWYTRNPS